MGDDDAGFVFDFVGRSDRPEDVYNTRELLIFVIDCTERMFLRPDEGDSPFKRSLQCCRCVLMNKIIASSNDLIGIVFYGTREKDPGDQNPKHVTTLTEPKRPNADIIKQLERMIKAENQQEFDSKYGHSNDFSLSDVFWHSSSLISRCTVKITSKKLILMTCSDNPHNDSPTKQHQARKKAEDLESLGIQLDVIPMLEDFKGDLLYNEIMQIVNGPQAQIEPGEIKIQEMLERQYRKDSKKRSLGKLSWNLGKDLAVGVDVYCFYRSLSVPPIRKLCRKTNDVVKSVVQTYNAETGERLLKTDLKQNIDIGSEVISFDMQEKENLHIHEKTGLTLLGFKSMSYLTPEYHLQPGAFLYPSEETIKGSTALFYKLLQQCQQKDKFALCYLVARARSKPKLVALVPQEEVVNTVQIMPPGFHVIYLPFAENIRQIEIPKRVELDPEQVELCKKIMKKITVKYKVSMFENPKVQTHWANVEALALNYPKPRDIVDNTLPDYEFISHSRLKNLETQFVETFYVDGYDPEEELARKRKYPAYSTSAGGSRAKVPKLDQSDPEYIRKMAIAGSADKLTVPVLKKFLTDRGMKVNGFKKIDLVSAVYQELEIDK